MTIVSDFVQIRKIQARITEIGVELDALNKFRSPSEYGQTVKLHHEMKALKEKLEKFRRPQLVKEGPTM